MPSFIEGIAIQLSVYWLSMYFKICADQEETETQDDAINESGFLTTQGTLLV